MNFFQRRKILKKANSLEMTPIRMFEHIIDKEGKLTIIVPKFKNKAYRNFFIPTWRTENIKIKLDELGSAMWLEIDGKRNVQDICNALTEKFGAQIHPAEERVIKFISKLYDNRYISFVELSETKRNPD